MPSHEPVAGESAADTKRLPSQSPNRNPKHNSQKPHITDLPITWDNWWKHINWLNCTFIFGIPLIGCIVAMWTPLRVRTAIWAVTYYFCTGLGITAGYHRLWAHKSYSARRPLEVFLALCGAASIEGSIRWWSRDHRAHHRYTDTTKDPYSVRKGLLYSHLGWMVMRQNPKRIGRTDISDLNENPIVVWQHRNCKLRKKLGTIYIC